MFVVDRSFSRQTVFTQSVRLIQTGDSTNIALGTSCRDTLSAHAFALPRGRVRNFLIEYARQFNLVPGDPLSPRIGVISFDGAGPTPWTTEQSTTMPSIIKGHEF